MRRHIEFITERIVAPDVSAVTLETGAQVEFKGIVRGMENGRVIAGLQYEAYVAMAEVHVGRMIEELGRRWPCHAVWFIHRLGWVPVGEVSLYVRAEASHREGAFRFCIELIDLLKKDAPIWKAAV